MNIKGKIRKAVIRWFGITESRTPKATKEQLDVPMAIVPFNGGIVINGPHKPEYDDTDDLIVGFQEGPLDGDDWGISNHIQTTIDGSVESLPATADNLLRALAEMLGYRLIKE